jgi:hypothetical protein
LTVQRKFTPPTRNNYFDERPELLDDLQKEPPAIIFLGLLLSRDVFLVPLKTVSV